MPGSPYCDSVIQWRTPEGEYGGKVQCVAARGHEGRHFSEVAWE